MSNRILVIDDDRETLEAVGDALEEFGYAVEKCRDAAVAREALDAREFDVVLTDLCMPGIDGLELSGRIAGNRPDVPVVMMTAFGDSRTVSSAMRSGVVDFLQKPFSLEGLSEAIGRALVRRQELDPVGRLPVDEFDDDSPLPNIIGTSAPMRVLARRVRQAARASCSVLITGETGAGKELVAQAVHSLSARASAPFVALNCAALPAEMIESELFGHAQGAFTGAVRSRFGLFRTADGGTLFLDEIGTMPLALQSRLLRVMEVGSVRAVGTVEETTVDVRIVAATNSKLRTAVAEGTFREDLLLRLSAFPIEVPPLRVRGDDVIAIARHFIGKFSGAAQNELTDAAARALIRYPWPGNARELENCIQAALVAAGSGPIGPEHLPLRIRDNNSGLEPDVDPEKLDLDGVERRHIQRVLRETSGNRSDAARKLGMNRVTLYRKLKRYGLG